MVFHKVLWWFSQVNLKEDSNFKVVKAMKSTSKNQNKLFAFEHHFKYLDLNLIFYIWEFNTTKKVIMKRIPI